MLNTKNNFKALSLSTESEVLNSHKLNTCSNEKGRSMIEMLGVLAIIGVLSVGGIAGYSKAMLKYKTNKTIDGVTMLVTNIRTLYAQQDDFTGLDGKGTGDVLNSISMGVVPDELQNSDKKSLTNPFSGSVTIDVTYSVKGPAGAGRAFVVGVDNIPKEACMAMATADWGSNYSSGLVGMAVANQSGVSGGKDAGGKDVAGSTAASLLLTDGTNAGVYAGGDCTPTPIGAETDVGSIKQVTGAYCAKDLPINVAAAASGCNCAGSNCSFAIKYY